MRCAFDIHIMNGRLFDDSEGNFICFANNGASVVDYILIASTSLFSKVSHFKIAELDFSEHLPVCCTFNFEIEIQTDDEHKESINLDKWTSYKWNPILRESFLHKFINLYIGFQNKLPQTDASVSTLSPDFIEMYQNAASSMKREMNNSKVKNKKKSSWWDKECSKAKYLK